MQFQCSVLRTHHLGERRRDNDPGQPVVGTVRMYSMPHDGLNRHVPRLTMESLAKFGARIPSAIPDLLDPVLLPTTAMASTLGSYARGGAFQDEPFPPRGELEHRVPIGPNVPGPVPARVA